MFVNNRYTKLRFVSEFIVSTGESGVALWAELSFDHFYIRE